MQSTNLRDGDLHLMGLKKNEEQPEVQLVCYPNWKQWKTMVNNELPLLSQKNESGKTFQAAPTLTMYMSVSG